MFCTITLHCVGHKSLSAPLRGADFEIAVPGAKGGRSLFLQVQTVFGRLKSSRYGVFQYYYSDGVDNIGPSPLITDIAVVGGWCRPPSLPAPHGHVSYRLTQASSEVKRRYSSPPASMLRTSPR